MSITVKHKFVSAKPEQADPTIIGPNEWNDTHLVTDTSNRIIYSSDYVWLSQTPGNPLVAGITNTVTLTPVPVGVNGSDVGHNLCITSGTGASESILITGGTAVSGAPSGTITFTPLNNYASGWTIHSATNGIQEAKVSLGTNGGIIILPIGILTNCGGIYLDTPIWLQGQGIDATKIAISNTTSNVIEIAHSHVTITAMYIDKAAGVGARTGNGIVVDGPSGTYVEGLIEDVRVYNQNIGIDSQGAFWINRVWCVSNNTGIRINSDEVRISHGGCNGNTNYGIWMAGGTGITLYDSGGSGNGISNIYATGNVADVNMIVGGSSVTGTGPGMDFSQANVANVIMVCCLIEISAAGQPALKVGNIDGLNIGNSTITAGGTSTGIQFIGPNTHDINIHGNYILGDITAPTPTGIDFSTSAANAWILVNGNLFKNFTNCIKVGNMQSGFTFTGNYCETPNASSSNPGNPIGGNLATIQFEYIVQPNYWTQTAFPTYSGAILALRAQETIVFVSSATPITSITDGFLNRRVTLIFTNTAGGAIALGGNINRAQTFTQNQSIILTFTQFGWF